MIYYIYTLEYNSTIFYVGKTISLSIRLNKHKKESILKRTHKEKFINKVLLSGGDIIINILDEVDKESVDFWEQYWISQIKSWGFKLYNGTNGGEGGDHWTGRKHKKETIDKLKEIRRIYLSKNNELPRCPGEKNGRSKLTESQVIEMRNLREYGYSYGKLAIKYKIAKATVCNIIQRKRWSHI